MSDFLISDNKIFSSTVLWHEAFGKELTFYFLFLYKKFFGMSAWENNRFTFPSGHTIFCFYFLGSSVQNTEAAILMLSGWRLDSRIIFNGK
jgi:hypothetical protein